MKIFIELKDNKLNFCKKVRLNTDQKSLINTNIISQNELIFSDEYIYQNKKIITSFLQELCNETNVSTITIREYSIAPIILELIKNISSIKAIYFLEQSPLTYKLCESILSNKNLKYISVYSLQTFMLEMLDKEDIVVDSRNEILYSSSFMINNNLDKFSSLYYKTSINIDFPLNEVDKEDLESFCKINKYLKTIYINSAKIDEIEYLLFVLSKSRKRNIKVIIKENIEDYLLIGYLKKINKLNEKRNKIKFKIEYSKDYLQSNLVDQIKINSFKIIMLLVIFIIFLIIIFVFISNYNSVRRVEDIKKKVTAIIDNYEDNNIPDKTLDNNTPSEELQVINKDIEALKNENEDTIGWLKVRNTNVDYPVVQASDNDYYLDKNFYKKNDASGWIFMDYRNNPKELSDNTIIFGHNMYYTGIMFGTLYKTKQSSWYTDVDNQIIEFNTLYENIKWKIFSIYTTPVTDDYLIANFSTTDKFLKFAEMITNRSIYNFGIPIVEGDKILTLTTCSSNGTKRLVIHAVRLN